MDLWFKPRLSDSVLRHRSLERSGSAETPSLSTIFPSGSGPVHGRTERFFQQSHLKLHKSALKKKCTQKRRFSHHLLSQKEMLCNIFHTMKVDEYSHYQKLILMFGHSALKDRQYLHVIGQCSAK